MSILRRFLPVLICFVAIGCAQEDKPKPTLEQMNGRMDAANAIPNSIDRNEAYKVIARDAADAGLNEVAYSALKKISDSIMRNDAAANAALLLAARGDTKGATEIASLISDSIKRGEVLKKIAKG